MQPYNVTRILTPDLTLDVEAYESYSPLYMSYVFLSFPLEVSTSERLQDRSRRILWVRPHP